jgi:CRP-like cAMP-binding protein
MNGTTKRYSTVKMSELFRDLPNRAFTQVLAAARPKDFATRDMIFVAGDPAKEVFLLLNGRVRIMQFNRNAEEVILRLELPGELIGESAPAQRGAHALTAQADQDCRTLIWDRPAFEAAAMRFPILQRNRQRIAERRIRELEDRFCEVSTAKVSPRVAHTLLRLLNQIGRHEVNAELQIDIEQEAVAKMTATTVWAVNQLLAAWEKQGLVSRNRGSIIIRSYNDLLQLCKATK